ncbi:cytochrome P450 [Nocardioides sp. J9]|uniref:cytochrome P450 n=1 Tax=Nocardioides sp. J9 TaxID=935844 RepID=UPI0011A6704C|nr:cytochrome P450 [Nocardioides sp. J9]TWG89683.1 cytochrome P450 [Nocardioides sp. J9]
MTVTEPTTAATDASGRAYHAEDISEIAFWALTAEEREETFKKLRADGGITYHPPIAGGLMLPENDGVWAVTSHELIGEVSKNPDIFCSGQGFQMEEVPQDFLEAAGSFLGMDAPKHGVIRKLVSAAFTPKQVAKMNDQIDDQARRIVDNLLASPEGDFVETVSKQMPMWTIYEMMGLEDPERRDQAAHHADGMVSWNDEDVAAGREPGELLAESLVGLLMMGMELAEERRADPREDLMTNLVNAEVDGRKLTDEEIGSFFVLLSVAGNDTTRNSITLATRALQQFPDQKALLLEDYDKHIVTAVEEFVRWVSPVMTFRRTVTRDTELGGQHLREGDWVAMIYSSGNRDEKVWADADVFDITREKNPHVGFGGGGPHYCLGNFVAKKQLRAIFKELLFRAPNLEVGEPEYLVGNFVRAVKRMPYTLR